VSPKKRKGEKVKTPVKKTKAPLKKKNLKAKKLPVKKKEVKPVSEEKELNRIMLKYYNLLLEKTTSEDVIGKEIKKMWRRFHDLRDGKVVKDITKIIGKNWAFITDSELLGNPFRIVFVWPNMNPNIQLADFTRHTGGKWR